jgi:hypothetical protein
MLTLLELMACIISLLQSTVEVDLELTMVEVDLELTIDINVDLFGELFQPSPNKPPKWKQLKHNGQPKLVYGHYSLQL